jgi:hypothetical protein
MSNIDSIQGHFGGFGDGSLNSLATIHYDYFNSCDGPLKLSWNGTIDVRNTFTNGSVYVPATSGYYMIEPNFQSVSGHHIVFMLDKNAIFYYNSLKAAVNIINHPNNNVTIELALQAPPGTVGGITCDLFSDFQYYFNLGGNSSIPNRDHYYNETGIVLTADQEVDRTITFDIAIPNFGYPSDGGYSNTEANFEALLVTTSGNYVFGFSGEWYGGWTHVTQY